MVLFCASKRAGGGGLVVRNGLNPLPQAPSVSAVAETMGYPPGVLQECVDLPREPRLLVGPDSDGLRDCYIINAFGDVGSDSL